VERSRPTFADFEHRKIIETLETLGIPLSTLNRKIKRLKIEVKRKGSFSGYPAE
jgi:DNA-binding NtrC family response regulator